MLFTILAVLTAMRFVMYGVMAQPPTWTKPSNGATITLDASDNTACDNVATINADSGDGSTVSYSVPSQTPDGGFAIAYDGNTGEYNLKCTLATIIASSATSYSVTLRATNSGVSVDRSVTITVSNLVASTASTAAPTAATTAATAASNHPPVFNKNSYTYTICKTSSGLDNGVTLTSVTVTDADAGQTLTFTISVTYLTMNGQNIQVANKQAILDLADGEYTLVVTAQDNGSPAQASSATLTVTITSDEAKCSCPNHVSSLALLAAGLAVLIMLTYMN